MPLTVSWIGFHDMDLPPMQPKVYSSRITSAATQNRAPAKRQCKAYDVAMSRQLAGTSIHHLSSKEGKALKTNLR